jgi:hypothetical protein
MYISGLRGIEEVPHADAAVVADRDDLPEGRFWSAPVSGRSWPRFAANSKSDSGRARATETPTRHRHKERDAEERYRGKEARRQRDRKMGR